VLEKSHAQSCARIIHTQIIRSLLYFSIASIVSNFPVPEHGISSGSRWRRWHPEIEASYENTEQAVMESQQGVVLQHVSCEVLTPLSAKTTRYEMLHRASNLIVMVS
jgi:hypothetical protein